MVCIFLLLDCLVLLVKSNSKKYTMYGYIMIFLIDHTFLGVFSILFDHVDAGIEIEIHLRILIPTSLG